jgi:hypothetical protein
LYQKLTTRVRLALAGTVLGSCAALFAVLAPASATAGVASHAAIGQPLNPFIAAVARQRSHPQIKAHAACRGRGACIIADAIPQWACDIQGAVVGAGIAIAFPEASAAWAILGQTGWTVGCDTIPKIYLSGGQVNGLYAYERQHAAAGCFYVWPRNHRTWKIKCTNYYA